MDTSVGIPRLEPSKLHFKNVASRGVDIFPV